ncbi:MAG TPA: glycosyltransferase [Flavisolibacter sp.]|nr:glycosyltransferase [Flavisolibacter sp.]
MNDFIHIVCLASPSPPDYGGAIDMYYKIISLHGIGKKIILHYFDYKHKTNIADLEKYCHRIYAYKREKSLKSFSLKTPFIIKSRINKLLINKLNEDEFPVILEGLHCTGIIPYLNKEQRVIIRMHNNEPEYYKNLSFTEKNIFKRSYLKIESILLDKYQKKLSKNITLACISKTDVEIFKDDYHFKNVYFIPCFIPWQSIKSKEEKGNYVLYHGNMSISENESAAIWLIKSLDSKPEIPITIAGKEISGILLKLASKYQHVRLINNPSSDELDKLIQNAEINILPSLNNTGVKLKLLHALIEGRFCITNYKGMLGTAINIDVPVSIANTSEQCIEKIHQLFNEEFSKKEIAGRQNIFSVYNNAKNALKLNELL